MMFVFFFMRWLVIFISLMGAAGTLCLCGVYAHFASLCMMCMCNLKALVWKFARVWPVCAIYLFWLRVPA